MFSSKLPAVVTQSSCLPCRCGQQQTSSSCHSVGLLALQSAFQQQTSSSCHSVSLLACRCVQLEAEKASKERTLLTVLTQFQEQGATLAISQEVEGELRAQLHTLTENCASLEAQVLSVAEGSAALQARCAALEVQAAQVKFRFG